MGYSVFGNDVFDKWLDQKTSEILIKLDHEKLSTEDMLVLTLKAQSNHFHHMDMEFRSEFGMVQTQFADIKKQFKEVEKRFDTLITILMWGSGLFVTIQLAILLKLYV